jgi:uncharacterized protein
MNHFWIPILLLVSLLGGCAGTPRSSFYTLGNQLPAPPPASQHGISLALGPIDLPQYLDRPQLVTRDGTNGLHVHEFNRWGGSLEEEIQRVLGAQLMVRLESAKVYAYPRGIVAHTDYRVALKVNSFDGQLGGPVLLDIGWTVFDDRTGEPLQTQQRQYRELAEGPGFSAYVEAMQRLLQRLGDDLAQTLSQLPHRD